MWKQIKVLTRLELVNLFGFNVLRHTRDKREKGRRRVLAVVLAVLIVVFSVYAGGQSLGMVLLGMPDIIPPYLTAVAGLLILFFDIFKAGGVIFNRKGYDIISSLPLSSAAIVVGRFARMYVEDLVIASVAVLPGILVYGVCERPDPGFYLLGLAGLLLLPLIPMSIAVFIGALITGIASRMKHKSIVEAGLSIALIMVVFAFSASAGSMEGELDAEMLKELSGTILSALEKIYPPSIWLGNAMMQSALSPWLLFAGVSVACAAAAVTIVSLGFHAICRALFGTSAKHNYRMRALGQDAVMVSLCRRELRRYFSSGVYVANTIVGPILGAAASVGLFAMGTSAFLEKLPFVPDLCSVAPYGIATVFCMMNLTSVSISMEGNTWWIAKSLPLEAKSVLDAKILASLVVQFPFYLVAEVFLLLALKPGFWNALWIMLVPALCIVFCSVFGITVNLRFPVLNWESEVNVVKQSAAGTLGGLGGALILLVCGVVMAVVPPGYSWIARLCSIALLSCAAVFLYGKNCRADLREIE